MHSATNEIVGNHANKQTKRIGAKTDNGVIDEAIDGNTHIKIQRDGNTKRSTEKRA